MSYPVDGGAPLPEPTRSTLIENQDWYASLQELKQKVKVFETKIKKGEPIKAEEVKQMGKIISELEKQLNAS